MANVEIYTRDMCGYCMRAKRVLEGKGVTFTEYNASVDPAFRAAMIERSGQRTFPQVFIDEHHVGGCDELLAFDRSGRLDAALAGSVQS